MARSDTQFTLHVDVEKARKIALSLVREVAVDKALQIKTVQDEEDRKAQVVLDGIQARLEAAASKRHEILDIMYVEYEKQQSRLAVNLPEGVSSGDIEWDNEIVERVCKEAMINVFVESFSSGLSGGYGFRLVMKI